MEPTQGGKIKFSFYKEKSQKGHTRRVDAFPEGTIKEFIPSKKLSYTWQHKDVPEFPETIVSWKLEEIGTNRGKSRTDPFRIYRKRRTSWVGLISWVG